MKRKVIILFNIIILITFIVLKPSYSYSRENIEDIEKIEKIAATQDAKLNLKDLEKYNSSGAWSQKFVDKVDIIFSAIRIVGIILSIIILMMIGLKYMFASTEEKAEYKQTLIPYVIGALLLFSGSIFARLIYSYVIAIVKQVS